MLTITDQILLSSLTPLDPRLANFYIDGGNVIIESIETYLLRVEQESRHLGMEVIVLFPAGEYSPTAFLNGITSENIYKTKYRFDTNITDEAFEEITSASEIVVDNALNTGSTNPVRNSVVSLKFAELDAILATPESGT